MTKPADSDPRAYPKMPLLAVSAAVFRDGRVLIAKRGRPPLDGIWSLPGGLVEPGETLAEAAAREVLEETGVEAESLGVADIVERYGGYGLLKPGTGGANLVLWLAGPLMLIVAGGVGRAFLRRRARAAEPASTGLTEAEKARLRDILDD